MIHFLIWFGILYVLFKAGTPWWIWAIFVLGSFLAAIM